MTGDGSPSSEPPHAATGSSIALILGAATCALFAWTTCRTVYFGDSGELIAAAQSLGVAHPPGYPLYTLLGRVALGWPWGEPAWSMNLLSGLFGGVCCGAVAWLTWSFTRTTAGAAAAALGLAVAPPFWSTATVAEVYTLHLALLALLLCCATAVGGLSEARWRAGAGLTGAVLFGLGLGHRPTLALALPAAWLVQRAAARLRDGGRRTASLSWPIVSLGAILALLLPAALYGSLILRARAEPALDWGRTVDLARLSAHVTTSAYGPYVVAPEGWLWIGAWVDLGRLLVSSLGPAGILFAALGLTGFAGTPGPTARAGYRWVPVVLGVPALIFGLSYATPDVEVLFLPLLLALFLAVGTGVADLTRRFAGKAWIGPVAAAAVALPLMWQHYPSHQLRHVSAARDYAEDMLASVPAGGVLFVDGDDAFLLAYATQVLGRRSDVTLYDRKGILFRDEATEPGSPPRGGETGTAYRIRREVEFVQRELRRQAPRPVLFMSWPGYELPPGLRFEPEGLFYRVRRGDEPRTSTERLWATYREARILEQAQALSDPRALTVAATYALMRGERALFDGDRTSALYYFDRAAGLAGPSESIHNYLGTVFGRFADYDRAIREFERAIEAAPVSVRAWNNLALARSFSGDVDGARTALRRSLELRPGQAEARRQLQQLGE